MERVFIRSKAKWIQEGEKPSNYFCNLENRNYISKYMNCLKTENGKTLLTQDEILKETQKHYQNLYTAKNTEHITGNLHTTFKNVNLKKTFIYRKNINRKTFDI
jgi:hypothetical protein